MKRSLELNLLPNKQKTIDGFFHRNGPPKETVSEGHGSRDSSETKGNLKTVDNEKSVEPQIEPTPEVEFKKFGRGKRKFQLSWLKDFEWLEYIDGIAKCKVCNLFPKLSDCNSRVVQGYSSNFKSETFKKHRSSQQHLRCEEALEAKEKPNETLKGKIRGRHRPQGD